MVCDEHTFSNKLGAIMIYGLSTVRWKFYVSSIKQQRYIQDILDRNNQKQRAIVNA